MLRKYTRTTCRGQWSTEVLQAASTAIKSGMHLREAAKKFGISITTLHQHHIIMQTPCSQSIIILSIIKHGLEMYLKALGTQPSSLMIRSRKLLQQARQCRS